MHLIFQEVNVGFSSSPCLLPLKFINMEMEHIEFLIFSLGIKPNMITGFFPIEIIVCAPDSH